MKKTNLQNLKDLTIALYKISVVAMDSSISEALREACFNELVQIERKIIELNDQSNPELTGSPVPQNLNIVS